MTIETISPTQKAHAADRLDNIQLLRALAAAMVVAFHLGFAIEGTFGETTWLKWFARGEAGVDLFFVISGFIILHTTLKRPDASLSRFVRSRVARIYPPFWVVAAVYIAVGLASSFVGMSLGYQGGFWEAIPSFFLLPNPHTIVTVDWTLKIEMLFYAIFALTFFTVGLRGFFVAMFAWCGLSIFLSDIVRVVPDSALRYALFSGNVEFLFGAGLALLFRRGPLRWGAAVLLGGTVLMLLELAGWPDMPPGVPRWITAGIPSAMIVYGALALPRSLPRSLTLLGDASYFLYLAHLIMISIGLKALGPLFAGSGMAAEVAGTLIFIGILCASTLGYLYIERPLQRLLKPFVDGRNERVRSSPAP